MLLSEHNDALLHDWLTTPNRHIDKPCENAKFYCFVAALMHDLGQLDIRELHCFLKETGNYWTSDFAERNGDSCIAVLCEHLQVLYDFFGAVSWAEAGPLPAEATSSHSQTLLSTMPSSPLLLRGAPDDKQVYLQFVEFYGNLFINMLT